GDRAGRRHVGRAHRGADDLGDAPDHRRSGAREQRSWPSGRPGACEPRPAIERARHHRARKVTARLTEAELARGVRMLVRRDSDLERIVSRFGAPPLWERPPAFGTLVQRRGIGPGSADIYLLMALGRPDVWPRHDLALASAMREVKRLRSVPGIDRQLEISAAWRPWRAVAARILWHHYLSTPRRR